MGRLYTLSAQGFERLIASETFQALTPDQQNTAEEFILTSFSAQNHFRMQTARMRADRLVALLGAESGVALRNEILHRLKTA